MTPDGIDFSSSFVHGEPRAELMYADVSAHNYRHQ